MKVAINSYYQINANIPQYRLNINFYDYYSDIGTLYSSTLSYQGFLIDYGVEILNNRVNFNYTIRQVRSGDYDSRSGYVVNYDLLTSCKVSGAYSVNDMLNVNQSEYVNVVNTDSLDWTISMGFNFYDIEKYNFDDAIYSVGFSDGYDNGYAYGYQVGLTDNTTNDYDGVFTLLGSAFDSASSLMNTQFIGGLTIGAFMTIPLAITVVIAIFRLVRK